MLQSRLYALNNRPNRIGKVLITLFYLPICALNFSNHNLVALWPHLSEPLKLYFELQFSFSVFYFQNKSTLIIIQPIWLYHYIYITYKIENATEQRMPFIPTAIHNTIPSSLREREREANLVCTYKVLVPEVGKIIANKRPTG